MAEKIQPKPQSVVMMFCPKCRTQIEGKGHNQNIAKQIMQEKLAQHNAAEHHKTT